MNSTVHLYPIDGAVPRRRRADATAFGHRDANFAPVIAGMWPDPADNERNIQWVRDYYAAIAPHSEAGGYVNFASPDDQDKVADNYGANYRRLTRGQAALRPRQPVPPQPEHQALTASSR